MADKTYVPGADAEWSSSKARSHEALNNPFSESKKSTGDGTVISGLDSKDEKSRVPSGNKKNKPIVGFLYSMSRTPFGEFWPLYLGPNKIGRAKTNDVVLGEGTVSSDHAILTVLKDDEGIFAAIENNGVNGVKVNGKSIRLDRVECNNMDLIKIGKNYELLVFLIDAEKYGLTLAEEFIDDTSSHLSGKPEERIIRRDDFRRRLENPDDRTRAAGDEPTDDAGATKTR